MSENGTAGLDLRQRLVASLISFTGNEDLRSIADNDKFADYGLDSLSLFNFLLDLEREYGFAIPEQEFTFARLDSLHGLQMVVSERLTQPSR